MLRFFPFSLNRFWVQFCHLIIKRFLKPAQNLGWFDNHIGLFGEKKLKKPSWLIFYFFEIKKQFPKRTTQKIKKKGISLFDLRISCFY
jgi:hypothetical protein